MQLASCCEESNQACLTAPAKVVMRNSIPTAKVHHSRHDTSTYYLPLLISIVMPHALLSTPMVQSHASSYPFPPRVHATTPTSIRIEPHALCCTCRSTNATSLACHRSCLTRYTRTSKHGHSLHNSCIAQSAYRLPPESSSSPSPTLLFPMPAPD